MEDDPFIVSIPQGIISLERMGELMSRYEIPPEYVCRILSNDKYISTPDPLEVFVCEETFWIGIPLPLHPFIERLLVMD